MVQIFFASATYDEVKRVVVLYMFVFMYFHLHLPQVNHDVKVTFEAAVGLIGGTMGLFTGFSVLSGIETIFFVAKFILSLRIPKQNKF